MCPPNDPVPGDGQGAYIYHRYAAAGNRDNFVDNTATDFTLGFQWQATDKLELRAGARYTVDEKKLTVEDYWNTGFAACVLAGKCTLAQLAALQIAQQVLHPGNEVLAPGGKCLFDDKRIGEREMRRAERFDQRARRELELL